MVASITQRGVPRASGQSPHHSTEEVRQRLLALNARASSGGLLPSVAQPATALAPDDDGDSSPFECNICLEMARDPVVTLCGHLYCWPCLYKWLNTTGKSRTCPVCKTAVDKKKVVPIYGRGGAAEVVGDSEKIPARPSGVAKQPKFMSMIFGSSSSQPSLMNSIFILEEEINSPEHQHQAILARLLLMLGSFVIMFLLLI